MVVVLVVVVVVVVIVVWYSHGRYGRRLIGRETAFLNYFVMGDAV